VLNVCDKRLNSSVHVSSIYKNYCNVRRMDVDLVDLLQNHSHLLVRRKPPLGKDLHKLFFIIAPVIGNSARYFAQR